MQLIRFPRDSITTVMNTKYHLSNGTTMINHTPSLISGSLYVQKCCYARQVASTHRVLLLLHGGKQLWRHPGQRATHVPAHKRCRLFLGQPQVGNFDDWSVEIPQIAQQVVTLQVKVDNSA